MEIGKYYHTNQRKIENLTTVEWEVALYRCKNHIKYRLKQKTLSGAHSASNLGGDPIDYYLSVAYEKILIGSWEWKDEYSLGQQMIRIANSYISKEVDKVKTAKRESLQILYKDIEEEFYDLAAPPNDDSEQHEMEKRLTYIENATSGDEQLEFMVEGLKEGKKRAYIAELLGIEPRQFDKLKEKLMKRIQKQQTLAK